MYSLQTLHVAAFIDSNGHASYFYQLGRANAQRAAAAAARAAPSLSFLKPAALQRILAALLLLSRRDATLVGGWIWKASLLAHLQELP